MGLNSKDSVVKEEFVEGGCEDSGDFSFLCMHMKFRLVSVN